MQLQVISNPAELLGLENEWESLITESANPSIFMTFDYQYAGWSAFCSHDSAPSVITVRDTHGVLVGIAPFKVFRDHGSMAHWRTMEYLNSFEIDRPCPVIRSGMEAEFWRTLRHFVIESRPACDVVKMPEMPTEQAQHVRDVLQSSRLHLQQIAGPTGIGIDLRTTWSDFTARHKNLRKLLARTERRIPDLKIQRYEDPDEILQGLDHYIEIERRSWKAGKIGITKNSRHEVFYADLLKRLAKRKRVTVRILKAGCDLVAGEITYTLGRRVFFHHGVYDQAHAAWSPGTYLSAVLLADYMDGGYDSGDYLCGFADYLRPWCDLEWKTVNTTIVRNSLLMSLSQCLANMRSGSRENLNQDSSTNSGYKPRIEQ